jgi:hypothetical protein
MALQHPSKVLRILSAILESDATPQESLSSTRTELNVPDSIATLISQSSQTINLFSKGPRSGVLDEFSIKWNDNEIEQIIQYVREWNTNSKNSFVCTLLFDSLLRTQGCEKLLRIKEFTNALDGLVSYSERHNLRISRLYQSSFLTEYITSLITSFPTQILPVTDTVATLPVAASGIKRKSRNADKPVPKIFDFAPEKKNKLSNN